MCEELNQGNSRKKTYAIDVILRQEVVRSGVTDFFFLIKMHSIFYRLGIFCKIYYLSYWTMYTMSDKNERSLLFWEVLHAPSIRSHAKRLWLYTSVQLWHIWFIHNGSYHQDRVCDVCKYPMHVCADQLVVSALPQFAPISKVQNNSIPRWWYLALQEKPLLACGEVRWKCR